MQFYDDSEIDIPTETAKDLRGAAHGRPLRLLWLCVSKRWMSFWACV